MTLEEMKLVDVRSVQRETLMDIQNITAKGHGSTEDKIYDYLEETGNPYCFRVGNVVVKNTYTDNGPKLDDLLKMLISSL